MKKSKLLSQPVNRTDAMSFADLYDEMSSEWELKAEQMQKRRWRELRRLGVA